MTNRLAAGFTIAGFPLTAALLAVSAGNIGLALPLAVLFVIGVGLTLAPKLPILNTVPLVGAPKLAAGFKANGSVEFRGPPDRPRVVLEVPLNSFPCSVLVQIGISNLSGQDVSHALINFGAPMHRGMETCDAWGRKHDVGQQMPPTHAGYDYWALEDRRLTGGDGRLFFFRFRPPAPGVYAVYVSVSSRALYREMTRWADIEIVARPSSEVGIRDALGPLIDSGELLARQIPGEYSDASARREYVAWFLEVLNLLSGAENHKKDFENTKADWPGKSIGDGFYLAELQAKLRFIYDLRDFLGRPAEQ